MFAGTARTSANLSNRDFRTRQSFYLNPAMCPHSDPNNLLRDVTRWQGEAFNLNMKLVKWILELAAAKAAATGSL